MTYIRYQDGIKCDGGDPDQSTDHQKPIVRSPTVLIVEDDEEITTSLDPICSFLDVVVEHLPSERHLDAALNEFRPMAVIARVDCRGQDGYHVMKTVAEYDRSLPILLLTGTDAVLIGAAEAIEEVWDLANVVKCAKLPGVAQIVDFLFRAGRGGRCTRFLPV